MADALPELAVVTPAATGVPGKTVGARATESPVWALALLVSVTLLVCTLVTDSGPSPPPGVPADSWVLPEVVCA